jgi:putative membrane protein insertion efficiency factor
MGYRDSPATVGGQGALWAPRGGTRSPAAEPLAHQTCPPLTVTDLWDHREGSAQATDGRQASVGRAGDLSGAAQALVFAIRLYQSFLSALMPSACKFYPSCSHYAAEAIRVHGARHGTWLALCRFLRCHPFTRGGVDLVPVLDNAQFQSELRSSSTGPPAGEAGFRGCGKTLSACHSERSEESLWPPFARNREILRRFAPQNDKLRAFFRNLFSLWGSGAEREKVPQAEACLAGRRARATEDKGPHEARL